MNGPVDIVVNGVAVPICAQLWPSLAAASFSFAMKLIMIFFLFSSNSFLVVKNTVTEKTHQLSMKHIVFKADIF